MKNCCALFGACTKCPLSHSHVLAMCDAGKYWLQIGGKQPTRGRARQAHITLLQLKSKWRTLWRRQGKLNSPESQGKQINVAFFCNTYKKRVVNCSQSCNPDWIPGKHRVHWWATYCRRILLRGGIFDGACSNIFANASHCLIEFTACKWRRN